MTRQLMTANGVPFVIDDEDFKLVTRYRWYAHFVDSRQDRVIKNRYIVAFPYTKQADGSMKSKTTYLHRLILGAKRGYQVDHANGDPLDNRRDNLRIATQSQQNMNKGLASNNSSGFKGVYLNKSTGRWYARITIPGYGGKKYRSLGTFATPEEASEAYDLAAITIHGEFAKTNDSISKDGVMERIAA